MSDNRFFHVSQDGRLSQHPGAAEALAARETGGYVWVDLYNPVRDDLLALAGPFGLHPLAIEDCLDENQVPKLEDFPSNTFVLFNRFHFRERALAIEEVDFFLGPGFLVSVAAHGRDSGAHERLEEAIRLEQASIGKGPDYLLHVILDRIVDDKLLAIEALQDDLDAAEEGALRKGPPGFNPGDVLHLRRDLLALRKSLFHEREILVKICRRDSPFISEAAIYHFRDIYDHLVKFVEVIEICREMIATLMELHLSLVNNELARLGNRTNQVVRRLTFITTIFMPLSFLAGVGGMSEWSMMTGPQNWRIAYPAFLGMMVAVGMFSYFLLKRLERSSEQRERSRGARARRAPGKQHADPPRRMQGEDVHARGGEGTAR
jgi:magnesium transporter